MSVTLAQAKEEVLIAGLALKKHKASKPLTVRTAGRLSFRTHVLNRYRGRGQGSRTNIKDASQTREWDNEFKRLKKIFATKKKTFLEIRKQERDKEFEYLVQKEAERQRTQEQEKEEQKQSQDEEQQHKEDKAQQEKTKKKKKKEEKSKKREGKKPKRKKFTLVASATTWSSFTAATATAAVASSPAADAAAEIIDLTELVPNEDEDEDWDEQVTDSDVEMDANGVIDLTGATLGKRKRGATDV